MKNADILSFCVSSMTLCRNASRLIRATSVAQCHHNPSQPISSIDQLDFSYRVQNRSRRIPNSPRRLHPPSSPIHVVDTYTRSITPPRRRNPRDHPRGPPTSRGVNAPKRPPGRGTRKRRRQKTPRPQKPQQIPTGHHPPAEPSSTPGRRQRHQKKPL